MSALTQERVRALFDYKPETGELIWRHRPQSDFATKRACSTWNSRFAGKAATSANNAGYLAVRIDYKAYLVHQIIWLHVHGRFPEAIDHKNHDRTDNRLTNLAETDHLGNQKNLSKSARNTSGATGVYWHARYSRWTAAIFANGKNHFLGSFAEKVDAIAARKAAEAQFGFHENHGRSFPARRELEAAE